MANGAPRGTLLLDQQLCLYNDLFGWARIAFPALADRPPPDSLYGPTASGTNEQYTRHTTTYRRRRLQVHVRWAHEFVTNHVTFSSPFDSTCETKIEEMTSSVYCYVTRHCVLQHVVHACMIIYIPSNC